jgi:hypothetical protein
MMSQSSDGQVCVFGFEASDGMLAQVREEHSLRGFEIRGILC